MSFNWKVFTCPTFAEFETKYKQIADERLNILRRSPFYWFGRVIGYVTSACKTALDNFTEGYNS